MLNTLRRSLGLAIADEAFAKWLARPVEATATDRDAEVTSDALWALVREGRLSIRRGGYVVLRVRGRVIVEPREDWPSTANRNATRS